MGYAQLMSYANFNKQKTETLTLNYRSLIYHNPTQPPPSPPFDNIIGTSMSSKNMSLWFQGTVASEKDQKHNSIIIINYRWTSSNCKNTPRRINFIWLDCNCHMLVYSKLFFNCKKKETKIQVSSIIKVNRTSKQQRTTPKKKLCRSSLTQVTIQNSIERGGKKKRKGRKNLKTK